MCILNARLYLQRLMKYHLNICFCTYLKKSIRSNSLLCCEIIVLKSHNGKQPRNYTCTNRNNFCCSFERFSWNYAMLFFQRHKIQSIKNAISYRLLRKVSIRFKSSIKRSIAHKNESTMLFHVGLGFSIPDQGIVCIHNP